MFSAFKTSGRILATASALALALVGAPTASFAQGPQLSQSVAAIVNDDVISSYDLVQRMRLLILTTGFQPTEETIPQIQQEALRSLIEERLQFQELRRVEKENKLTIILTDKELDEQLERVIQGEFRMTADQFYAQLAASGIGRDTYREQMRAELSWRDYMHGRFGQRLRVGEEQVKAYQLRLAEAAQKPQYQISEIYIDAARVGGMQVAYNGAQQLVGQIQQGAPFPNVARQFSAAPTAAAGGDAGWVSPGELPPQVDQVLEQLRPGQLSPPIATDEGVYIIYLREKRAGGGAQLVTMKQAAVAVPADAPAEQVAAATALLERVRALNPTCSDLEAKATQISGVLAGDLGETEVTGLAPGFAEAVAAGSDNTLSAPIRTQGGVHLVMVCGRRSSGAGGMTDEQIQTRLYGQQLGLISKRVLRDLKTAATIETR